MLRSILVFVTIVLLASMVAYLEAGTPHQGPEESVYVYMNAPARINDEGALVALDTKRPIDGFVALQARYGMHDLSYAGPSLMFGLVYVLRVPTDAADQAVWELQRLPAVVKAYREADVKRIPQQ